MDDTTRRRFLQAATASAAIPFFAMQDADAGDPLSSAEQSLTNIVRQRFKHLTEAQIKTVQTGVQRNLAMAEILKRNALEPVDEPATVFVADVAEL
jgi:hypothetical protein